jgi:hypothetical protein
LEKTTLTLGEIIENNVDIFDFDYPFYNEERRKQFEQHFIEHFYFDEIGQETVARFKQRLKIKLNLIMPYWNKIFLADELEQRILDNYSVTETYESSIENSSNAENENNINTSNESVNKNLESDTPVTKTDFNQVDYFSNIVKDIGSDTSNTTASNIINANNNRTENWTRKMEGNIGVQTDADAIIKYWQSLRQIEIEIFKQCSDLFMEVY